MIIGIIVGAILFSAGVIVGAKLERIIHQLDLGRQNPFEGKNGLLSYKNIKLRNIIDDADEDMDDDDQ